MPILSTLRRRSKTVPAGETGEEVVYLRTLSEKQTYVSVKLRGGEVFEGWIEYFDDRMIRLTRDSKPNLFLYKNQILTLRESDKRQMNKPNRMDEGRPQHSRSQGQLREQA
jgi:host factor-I protein